MRTGLLAGKGDKVRDGRCDDACAFPLAHYHSSAMEWKTAEGPRPQTHP